MTTWLINGVTPESLGLIIVGGDWRTGGPSTITLKANQDFDAAEQFAHGQEVIITRGGVQYFVGRVTRIPKTGTETTEGHQYVVEDAWADMEKTVYQELWYQNGGSFLSPQVVLGLNSAGAAIGIGDQIREAITFAANSGINIQAGSIPAGPVLWPSESVGITIAEVIRTSLRLKPDWTGWIDHSTTPPTFNVTSRADADAIGLAVTDCGSFECTKTEERVPDTVRIVYTTAQMVDEEVCHHCEHRGHPA